MVNGKKLTKSITAPDSVVALAAVGRESALNAIIKAQFKLLVSELKQPICDRFTAAAGGAVQPDEIARLVAFAAGDVLRMLLQGPWIAPAPDDASAKVERHAPPGVLCDPSTARDVQDAQDNQRRVGEIQATMVVNTVNSIKKDIPEKPAKELSAQPAFDPEPAGAWDRSPPSLVQPTRAQPEFELSNSFSMPPRSRKVVNSELQGSEPILTRGGQRVFVAPVVPAGQTFIPLSVRIPSENDPAQPAPAQRDRSAVPVKPPLPVSGSTDSPGTGCLVPASPRECRSTLIAPPVEKNHTVPESVRRAELQEYSRPALRALLTMTYRTPEGRPVARYADKIGLEKEVLISDLLAHEVAMGWVTQDMTLP